MTMDRRIFDTLPDGRTVHRWTIRNAGGAALTLLDLGAVIQRLEVPDRDGRLADVVLGFDRAAPYLDCPYFGAVVGRFANRVAGARFTLDGVDYRLAANDGPNSLHGGAMGFDKRLWHGESVSTAQGEGVRFSLVSADGEEGYPGAVNLSATYVWTDDSQLIVEYAARATPFSVSQHSYFNLGGASGVADSVLGHELTIPAAHYLAVDRSLIPTGQPESVTGTPFDFRTAKAIGRDIAGDHPQLTIGGGYDHNWIADGEGLRIVARLHDPASGRVMEVCSDMPGLQVYTGNVLDGTQRGKGGVAYDRRCAVALETQFFPDSPNRPDFPSCILRPGEAFSSRTIFAFSTAKPAVPADFRML
ncbi:aldose epimerase family protein [Sphingobium aquiterrae]|uniref:aldose epimerase family protein n=1 Tax=Sphingobium aquiterrae TaxID=2038656 RepID=UPI0030194342